MNLKVKRDTWLAFGNIGANGLSRHVVWSISDFWGENARCVGAEDGSSIGGASEIVNSSLVLVDGLELLKSGKITAELLCLLRRDLLVKSIKVNKRKKTYWS